MNQYKESFKAIDFGFWIKIIIMVGIGVIMALSLLKLVGF